jgi:hypothetical protein
MNAKSANAAAEGEYKIIFLKEGITTFIGVCVRLVYVMSMRSSA